MSDSQNIKVAVRVRNIPSWHGRDTNSVKHTEEYNQNIVAVDDRNKKTGISSRITIKDPATQKEDKNFGFDYVFSGDDGQDAVYDKIVAPIVERCLEGFNGCIFAYGQTASGKTYTMGGPAVSNPKDKGIIPRISEQITKHIEKNGRKNANGGGIDFQVSGSYLEIYKEELKDLLADDSKKDLKIRVDPSSVSGKELYVQGLTQIPLITTSDYSNAIDKAISRRMVAETNMNAVSSRSHSVFTISITQSQRFVDDSGGIRIGLKKQSKIHLIDLAGSERANSTGATGETLKEGAAINQSLSCLGNVINGLTTNSKHIPYRDSKLTYLLSDSLGGNSITLMIACLTPIAGAYEETLSTLRFAERAKKIKNNAVVNVDATTLRIMALEAENAELKMVLSQCKCRPQSHAPTNTANAKEAETKRSFRKLSAIMGFKNDTSKVVPSPILETVEEVEEDGTPSLPQLPPQLPIQLAIESKLENAPEKEVEGLIHVDIESRPSGYNYDEYMNWYRKTYMPVRSKTRYIELSVTYVLKIVFAVLFVAAMAFLGGFGAGFASRERLYLPVKAP